MSLLLLILVIFCASFVQACAGFGFSMVALSLMTFFLPMLGSSVICVLAMLPLTLFISVKGFQHINWRILIIPFISAVITTQIGIRLLMVSDNAVLVRWLGGILIAVSLTALIFKSAIKISPTLPVQFVFGSISGMLSGLFNIGGPPMAIYMFSATQDNDEYHATLQTFFLLTALLAIVTHLAYGNITAPVLNYTAYALIGVFLGTLCGRLFFRSLSTEQVRKLIYGVMLVMGCVVLAH